MNLFKKCVNNDLILLQSAGIQIENKEYSIEELKIIESKVTDYIMSASKVEIPALINKYNNILNLIN